MTRETYLDDADAREWALYKFRAALSEEQSALIRRCTSAFVLYGNEDCPERVDFYSTNCPMNGEAPMITVLQNTYGDFLAFNQ